MLLPLLDFKPHLIWRVSITFVKPEDGYEVSRFQIWRLHWTLQSSPTLVHTCSRERRLAGSCAWTWRLQWTAGRGNHHNHQQHKHQPRPSNSHGPTKQLTTRPKYAQRYSGIAAQIFLNIYAAMPKQVLHIFGQAPGTHQTRLRSKCGRGPKPSWPQQLAPIPNLTTSLC